MVSGLGLIWFLKVYGSSVVDGLGFRGTLFVLKVCGSSVVEGFGFRGHLF